MSSKRQLTRRTFLGSAAGAAGWTALTAHTASARTRALPPGERLNIAGIGVGGKGSHDMHMVAQYSNVVALCDVDAERGKESFDEWPKAKRYEDFRVMLDKHANELDAVVIATPDHVHAFAAMACIEAGLHVYVEKPMAHSIPEVRALTAAAKKYKVATQMGNQGHSNQGCHILKTWVEDNAIGPISKVHCFTNRPTWPQGIARPTDTPPVPKSLNWDLWLGPAPFRPYHPAYCPRSWRGWWDFGTGALGDMGCHILDAAFFALDLGYPTRVSAESTGFVDDSFPKSSIIKYEFPARGAMPPVELTWFDGGNMPPRPEVLEEGRTMGDRDGGTVLYGDGAVIMCGTYSNPVRIYPEEKMDAYDKPDRPPRMGGHHENWIEACKGREEARSRFEYAGPLTEMVLLGNIALRAGQPIEYDPKAGKITNPVSANAFLEGNYREGWTL